MKIHNPSMGFFDYSSPLLVIICSNSDCKHREEISNKIKGKLNILNRTAKCQGFKNYTGKDEMYGLMKKNVSVIIENSF